MIMIAAACATVQDPPGVWDGTVDADGPVEPGDEPTPEGPVDPAVEAPEDAPVETPGDPAVETPEDAPVETPADTPADVGTDEGSTGCTGTLLSVDFESGDGGFTESPGDTVWAWGAIGSGPPSSGHGNVWGTNLSGSYGACEDAYLASPSLDLSACGSVTLTLTLDIWYEYERFGLVYYDGCLVELWTGSSWVQLAPVGGWDERVDIYGCSGSVYVEGKECFAGESGGWVSKTFTGSLTSYPRDFRFRFVHGSDSDGHYDGAFVDNVLLTGSP